MNCNKRFWRFVLPVNAIFLALLIAGCGGDPELKRLINELDDDEAGDRYDAAKELEGYGARAAPAVKALGKCLRDEDVRVRYRAAKVLAKIGRASSAAAIPLAKAAAHDSDEKVRYYSAKTLDEIADQVPGELVPAIPHLIEALSAEDSKTRYYIAKSLGKIGGEAIDAVGALEQLVGDPDEKVQSAAESSARRIKKYAVKS